jgi:uncharacterized protein YodC (DUF2158 family)
MATINQSPSGQASIAISGISFAGLVVGSDDPFRAPAVRVQDGGPSVAISGIDFTNLAASGDDPFRAPAVRVQDGGPSIAIGGTKISGRVLVIQSLRGSAPSYAENIVKGMLSLDDQIAIKRAESSPS